MNRHGLKYPSRSSRAPGNACRAGFTLVEMLVVISIIAILAALLLPSLQRAIGTSRLVSCANQMRQVGIWATQYADTWNNILPVNGGRSTLAGTAPANSYSAMKISPWDSTWYWKTGWVGTWGKVYKGTLLHCPQAVSSVQPISGYDDTMNNTYGLSFMMGGDYLPAWPNPPAMPRLRNLKSGAYWFGEAGSYKAWSPSTPWYGYKPDLCLFSYAWSNSGARPWGWNLDTSLPTFEPHPGGQSNFLFGDLHLSALTYSDYAKKTTAEKYLFDGR